MRLKHVVWGALGLCLLAGCASKGEVDALHQDMDEMKTRLFTLESGLNGLRTETHQGIEKSLKGYQQDIETLRKGTADLQATLDSARVDMQVLTGKVDDVTRLAKKPAEDIDLLREDTTQKMKALDDRLQKVEKELDDLQKSIADLKTTAAEQTPDALYQKGLDAYRAQDYQKARDTMTQFLKLYPNNDLAANAQYWLGETYYSTKNYDQAILAFQTVIQNFPGKDKVPAAMLKQALAFKELGDMKSARYVLRKLVDDYPLTDEAKTAKTKLRELK